MLVTADIKLKQYFVEVAFEKRGEVSLHPLVLQNLVFGVMYIKQLRNVR